MNKIYYNENNVGLVNYTGGGSADIPSALTSCEFDEYGRLKNFVIKDGVTSIPSDYQHYNPSLSSCTIPSGITSIGDYAFAYVAKGSNIPNLNVSNINLAGINTNPSCKYMFYGASLCGNLTIPNSLLSGATSGGTSTCYNMFSNATCNGDGGLTINVYADNVVIPIAMFYFYYATTHSDDLNLIIHGTPTFLSQQAFACSTGGSITFADCITPPNAPAYDTTYKNPFNSLYGTLYVPSAGLSAWQNKYPTISSKIKAIGT